MVAYQSLQGKLQRMIGFNVAGVDEVVGNVGLGFSLVAQFAIISGIVASGYP